MKVYNVNAAILLLSVFGGTTEIAAASPCDNPVTVDTKLDGDLECSCRGGQHLVDVKEGAILDLNGYSIKCAGNTRAKSCIHLDGFAATVVNGAVENCKIGIHMDGIGSHRATGVTVKESGKGVYIQKNSDHNEVIANDINADGIGIQIIGDHAVVRQNTVISKDDDGIEMDNDARNALVGHNKVLSAKKDCIRVHGDDAKVEGNVVKLCGQNGIFFRGDSSNVMVSYNKLSECGENGIFLEGGRVVVVGNTVIDSGSDGVEVRKSADDPEIVDNYISKSGRYGILVVNGDNSAAIEGNTINHSGDHGINVEGKPAKIVRGNFVFNCAGTGLGISLENESLVLSQNILSQCL